MHRPLTEDLIYEIEQTIIYLLNRAKYEEIIDKVPSVKVWQNLENPTLVHMGTEEEYKEYMIEHYKNIRQRASQKIDLLEESLKKSKDVEDTGKS